MTDPIDRFLAEERAAAMAVACGEPIPPGWSVVTGVELGEAAEHNREAMERWKLGRKKKRKPHETHEG